MADIAAVHQVGNANATGARLILTGSATSDHYHVAAKPNARQVAL